ncbi:MAG: hypothetical protein A2Y61_00250 [Chloroflexi bacterium RBG_13_60_13]|nr:MAG: hypothetical protein A2Y61_00250 [Chloroflexi bacterium RBG_13_60_13]
MSSFIAFVKEKFRQQVMEDEDFLKRHLFFFEMRVPFDVATLGGFFGFLFPIVIPPRSYMISEPFTLEAIPTQGGGLYVEENGIVQRTIRIQGTTGFKPRPLKVRLGDAFPAILDAKKKSYTRELPDRIFDKISGQRHMHYLQDAVFRTYADLKRDPATAADTALIFHNPADRESWLVAPREFSIERDASAPHLYNYNIELLVLDKATVVKEDFSEDKGLFDTIKDRLRAIRKAIDMATGAINDLTALAAEIRSVVNEIDNIIDSVNAVLDAATDFVNGVTSLIEVPFTFVESAIQSVESSIAHIHAWVDQGAAILETTVLFPEIVIQKFATLQDSFETLASFPSAYERSLDTLMRLKRELQESRRSLTDDRKQDALDYGNPTTLDAVRSLGTQLTAGDVQSAEGQITAGSLVRTYKSARQVTIEDGDTLAGLAARYMGDARLWQYIAVINGLKPPYIDSQASVPLVGGVGTGSVLTGGATGADETPFSKALGVGSKILIPTNQTSSLDLPILPVMGVKSDEPAENQLLGTDFLLDAVGGNYGSSREQYDIPIDTEGGGVDAKLVRGMDNMAQAVVIRMLTDRGTDSLYKQLGVQRVVSMGFTSLDLAMARFRIIDAIARDPRVASIQLVKFQQGDEGNPATADQLKVDLKVRVRGFSESRPVQVIL